MSNFNQTNLTAKNSSDELNRIFIVFPDGKISVKTALDVILLTEEVKRF
jgi:hypothetical protein